MVVRALKKSYVVKVCSNLWNIKRRIPFQMSKEIQTHIDDCTMYLEGLEQRDQEWTAEEIIDKYFRDYKVRNIHIPKNKDGQFKGVVTIEFDSVATVQ